MESKLIIVVLVSSLGLTHGQPYTAGCGAPLQDIPNPSSDTCTAFYRCFQHRQYSLRCPMGQAFDFDRARCRPENEIDCPLQLQRFQAPAIPHHLRSPNSPPEREVEIRVVHLAPGVDPNSLQFFSDGRLVQATRQNPAQRGSHTLIAAQQQQNIQPTNAQQTPVFLTQPNLAVQGQIPQGQFTPVQTPQGQIFQGQLPQGQFNVASGQPLQVPQSHTLQGQPVQGQFLQPPSQSQLQVQG